MELEICDFWSVVSYVVRRWVTRDKRCVSLKRSPSLPDVGNEGDGMIAFVLLLLS